MAEVIGMWRNELVNVASSEAEGRGSLVRRIMPYVKAAVLLTTTLLLSSTVSYIYARKLSFSGAIAGYPVIWLFEWGLLLLLGIPWRVGLVIVTTAAIQIAILLSIDGQPELAIHGGTIGAPLVFLDAVLALGKHHGLAVSLFGLLSLVVVAFVLGWRRDGGLALFSLWLFMGISDPLRIILANAEDIGYLSDSHRWIGLAFDRPPWERLVSLSFLLALGMIGLFAGKHVAKSRDRE